MEGSTGEPAARAPSQRKHELLERAYRYALEHGLAELSLRPLATAIGSSPRVLLFLFGSKDGLVRALLARARADELELLEEAVSAGGAHDLPTAVEVVWKWLAAEEHRPVLGLWVEVYGRSLVQPEGPWADFARQTVEDWLAVLATTQSPRLRRGRSAAAERTLALSVLRGALLDLLATGDVARTSAAVQRHVEKLAAVADD